MCVQVWDTSEPYGAQYSQHQEQHLVVGAARDPTRWADWADIIILVSRQEVKNFLVVSQNIRELRVRKNIIILGLKSGSLSFLDL